MMWTGFRAASADATSDSIRQGDECMANGASVKTLKQGFGFLKMDDGSEDLFFLPTSIPKDSSVRFDDLQPGQKVSVEKIEQTEKGLRATRVLVV